MLFDIKAKERKVKEQEKRNAGEIDILNGELADKNGDELSLDELEEASGGAAIDDCNGFSCGTYD